MRKGLKNKAFALLAIITVVIAALALLAAILSDAEIK